MALGLRYGFTRLFHFLGAGPQNKENSILGSILGSLNPKPNISVVDCNQHESPSAGELQMPRPLS